MNKEELILWLIAWVITQICYSKLLGKNNKKHKYVFMIISAICLFFSINHLTQIVTVDEEQYMAAFSNLPFAMQKLYIGDGMSKSINEYRISQILIGTIMTAIAEPVENFFGFTLVLKLYKSVHWIWSYGLILFIVYIIDKYFIVSSVKNNLHKRALSISILYVVLVILPVNILMNKVGNYDSLSVLFSVIALLLSVVAIQNKSEKISYIAIIAATLAAMEKSSATIFWPLCFVLTLIVLLEKYKSEIFWIRLKGLFFCCVKVVFISVTLSYCTLKIIFWITASESIADLGIKMSLSKILFPFIYYVNSFISADKFSMQGFELSNPIMIFIIVILCVILSALSGLAVIKYLTTKKNRYQWFRETFLKWSVIIQSALLVGGGVFAVRYAFQIAPYVPIKLGEYQFMREAGGWGYHYGVESKLGYELVNVLSHYGLIVTALPSVIMMGGGTYYLFLQWGGKKRTKLLYEVSMLSAFLMPICFAIVGVPSTSHRYYGTIINFWLVMLAVFFINNFIETKDFEKLSSIKRCGSILGVALLLYVTELFPFYPNVTFFSPIWNSQKRELITGYWHFNEPMLWGEDLALAGEKILQLTDKEDTSKNTIYFNYGQGWYENPGFQLKHIDEIKNEGVTVFEQTDSYISLSRFALFRKEIPDFITEIEPIEKISYKGNIAVWIYRADQLKGYESYFLE